MTEEVNKEYAPLLAYLTEIMQNLQNQSDVLRGKDIKICLRDDKEYTDNACVSVTSGIIGFGKTYLQKMAAKGEDFVAHTIAHELSHIVYHTKHNISGHGYNKEDEVFADNYAHILCHRAGYNINLPFQENPLTDKQNPDEHPADKIRQMLMDRTAAYLTDENSPKTVRPFREPIPDTPLTEVYQEMVKANSLSITATAPHKVQTDLQTLHDNNLLIEANKDRFDKQTNAQIRLQKILQSEDFASKTENIYLIDFHKIDDAEFLALYCKILENPEMFDDQVLQLKIRDYCAELCNINLNNNKAKKHLLPDLDDEAIETIKDVCANVEQKDFREHYLVANRKHQSSSGFSEQAFLIDHLTAEKRFQNPQHRQELYNMFAEVLKRDIGLDRDSTVFSKCLSAVLEQLNGKIHNADAIPLMKTLRKKLKIEGPNLMILQKFAKDNSIEINQIRTELLITKCLLDGNLAQNIVAYLMSDGKRKPPVSEDFEVAMRDTHKDWQNISPSKRADYFALLLENVPADSAMQKIDIFIDKKDDLKNGKNYHDNIYRPLIEMYLSTYIPEQQPYVAATLLSRKKTGVRYGYEDYFKEILNSSGIKGLRALNQIYGAKLPEEILKIETNMSPLRSEDGIIFANLRKLGAAAQKSDTLEIRKIGRHLMIATQSKVPLHRSKVNS